MCDLEELESECGELEFELMEMLVHLGVSVDHVEMVDLGVFVDLDVLVDLWVMVDLSV